MKDSAKMGGGKSESTRRGGFSIKTPMGRDNSDFGEKNVAGNFSGGVDDVSHSLSGARANPDEE